MRFAWKDGWRSSLTLVKLVGIVFGAWVVVGLFWPLRLTNWDWGLVLIGCAAFTGFWASWKGTSLLSVLLGALLAVIVIVLAAVIATLRLAPVPVSELIQGLTYSSLATAIATAIGFWLAHVILSRRRQSQP